MTKKAAYKPLENESVSEREDNSGSDSTLEHRPAKSSSVKKDGQPKKPYIYTEARKAAFERARKAREEMTNTKKEIIETKKQLREVKKEKLSKLKDAVVVEVKKKEKLEKKLQPSSDEESDHPPIEKPRKKKAKKVKQVMYYSSDSTSDSSDDDSGRRSRKPLNVVVNTQAHEPPKRLPPRTGLFI